MEQKCLIYLFMPFASAQVQVDVCIFTPTNFWIDIFGRVLWIYVLSWKKQGHLVYILTIKTLLETRSILWSSSLHLF